MAQKPDPLTKTAWIVDADRTPTSFFIRQWNLLLAFVSQTLDSLTTLAAEIAKVLAVRIETTAPIAGGGALLALQPISHNDSGVTPGTYGDATHVGQVTVDAKGHVTGAANVAITFPTPSAGLTAGFTGWVSPAATAQAHAFVGNKITPLHNMTITGVVGYMDVTVNNAVYEVVILELNGSNVVQAVHASPTYTNSGTGAKTLYFEFASPVSLVAGTAYAVMFGRTDATTTTASSFNAANNQPGLNMPVQTDAFFWQLDSVAPAIGDTVVSSLNTFRYTMTLLYTLTA